LKNLGFSFKESFVRRWCLWALLLLSPSLWGEAPMDLESPFDKILLIKNEKGEIQKKLAKKTSSVDGNLQGESADGVVYVVAKESLVAVFPVCPNESELVGSKSIQEAIQLLERTPEELKAKAEITPRIMVQWDLVLKESRAREEKLALEEKKRNEAREKEEKEKRNEETTAWLKEAKDFMKPRTEGEISDLMKRGGDLKKGSSGEIEECLAVLSQVLPKEKGGPLPDLQKLTELQPEILPDDMLIWFAGGVYLASLFLLLFGLSYLSNFLTCLQSKFWTRAVLYSVITPLFFVGLYYLWWPTEVRGNKISRIESDKFSNLNIYFKNQIKPLYYFPKKELSLGSDELVSGILAKLTPSEKPIGFLKGRMAIGELTLNHRRWAWRQGISLLGLPMEIPLLFEGPIPEPAEWENPKIDKVILGQIKLPECIANILVDSMVTTFCDAIRVTALTGMRFSYTEGGLLSIVIPESGLKPAIQSQANRTLIAATKEIKKPIKKEIAAEDLAREIHDYQGRFVLLDGYVRDVDSGGEFSGDSKAVSSVNGKTLGDKLNGQIGLDRFDKFTLEGGLICIIKSKGVFTMDAKGDIYLGPRANYVQAEPIIKKGQRVKFLTEGRVEGNHIYGIRLDEPNQISCYDPQQVIEFNPLKSYVVGDSDFDLDAKATSKLPITFESSDPTVAEIYKGNRVKIKNAGQTLITATQAGNSSWLSASATQILTVEPSK